MALTEYEGAIVMEVDGKEVDIVSLDVTNNTGRKLVKTMNKTGRAAGFSKGVQQIDLKVTAVIPTTGSIDWAAIEGAKITVAPVGGGQRTSYLDCFTVEVGQSHKVDDEATQDLTMHALREVSE